MTVKQYLEMHRGFTSTGAALSGHSIIYHYRDRYGKELTTETMPNGSTKVTLENETRIVPSAEDILSALNDSSIDKEEAVIRIFSQVLDKLLRKHRGDIHGDVVDTMERHARQQL